MLKPRSPFPSLVLFSALTLACLQAAAVRAAAPVFTNLIIFGDSLSDVGNDADLADDKYGIRFPGPSLYDKYNDTFDVSNLEYTDGRFTDGGDTVPATTHYVGVWHEQLSDTFLGTPIAKASLDGGFDYAYGGAVTTSGTSTLSYGEDPASVSLDVDNMGKQVDTYLSKNVVDPKALYIVWGGANDLFNNDDAENVTNAAAREVTLVQRLAEAGAKYILVPNLPPLDLTPDHHGDAGFQKATMNFNSQLKSGSALSPGLDGLANTLAGEKITGVTIYQLDVYNLFLRLQRSPSAYGINNLLSMAQGSDLDPDATLFWDGVHPTTAGHFQLAAEAYTLLSGIPVVEVYPKQDKTGVYVTRTGTDLSKKLVVHYASTGSAVSGVDYTALPGKVKLRHGKVTATVALALTNTDHQGRVFKLKLLPDPTYARPIIKKAKIKLD